MPDPLQTNKDVVTRHFIQGVTEHRAEVYDEIMAEDYRLHVGLQRDLLGGGRAGYQQGIAAFWRGFPDMRIELLDLVAEGDTVVAHYIERGTHTGDYRGRPGTGRSYEKHGFGMYTVVDGLMREGWVQEDDAGFARQLGLG